MLFTVLAIGGAWVWGRYLDRAGYLAARGGDLLWAQLAVYLSLTIAAVGAAGALGWVLTRHRRQRFFAERIVNESEMIPLTNGAPERQRPSPSKNKKGVRILIVLALVIGVSPVLWALHPGGPLDFVRSYVCAGTTPTKSRRPTPRRARSPSVCDVPLLVSQLLDHPDPARREMAASRLGRCGAGVPQAVAALARGLEDEDVNVRWAVDRALAELGPDAADAVPALIRLLGDRERKEWASWVLYRIGAPAVAPLVEQLHSPRAEARRSAAYALRSMGLRPANVRRRCQRGCELTLRTSEGIPVQVTILR